MAKGINVNLSCPFHNKQNETKFVIKLLLFMSCKCMSKVNDKSNGTKHGWKKKNEWREIKNTNNCRAQIWRRKK